MKIVKDDYFWSSEDERTQVLQIFPDVHADERGSFAEQWKILDSEFQSTPWIQRESWVKQANLSKSAKMVFRGCHAQSGKFCQAKLVTSISGSIFDIITDMRPQSDTFCKTKVYFLNPNLQNKIFVPRGFLHSFLTGAEDGEYIFQYMCDNVYSKASEVKVNPSGVALPSFAEYCSTYGLLSLLKEKITLSEEDTNGMDFGKFRDSVKKMWDEDGGLWYDDFDSTTSGSQNVTTEYVNDTEKQ